MKKVVIILLVTIVVFLLGAILLHEIVLPFQIQQVNHLIQVRDYVKLENYLKTNRFVIKSWPFMHSFLTAFTDSTPMLSPLAIACRENDENAVGILLEYGSDPNFVPIFQNDNYTALNIAAAQGNIESVCCLLEAGANASVQGTSAVGAYLRYRMNCRQNGITTSIEDLHTLLHLLQKYDYVLSSQSSIEYTPMEYAALYGDVEVMRILKSDYGIDASVQMHDGRTILHLYILSGWQTATAEDVTTILEFGIDPEIEDSEGKTAHDYAVEKGYEEIAQLLAH